MSIWSHHTSYLPLLETRRHDTYERRLGASLNLPTNSYTGQESVEATSSFNSVFEMYDAICTSAWDEELDLTRAGIGVAQAQDRLATALKQHLEAGRLRLVVSPRDGSPHRPGETRVEREC